MTEKARSKDCMNETPGLENKSQTRAGKRSQIPVSRTRAPFKHVQVVERPRSAVKKVPDFKQLHKQWERKMQKAKETQRTTHTPMAPTIKAPPHTVKPVKLKREEPVHKTTDRIDVILARMALSTTQAIRQMNKTEAVDCSPVKVNLEQEFTAVQEPIIKQSTAKPIKHVTLPGPKRCTYYDSEPELVDIVYTRSSPVAHQSGRRNPVGQTFNNIDCYFIPISSH